MGKPMFQNLEVYAEAKNLHKEIFRATSLFPKNLDYLSNQLRRAALSVVLNIAEGSAKTSKKEFNRFVQMALGSTYEVLAGLEVAQDITDKNFEMTINQYATLRNRLGGLSKHLTSL